MAEEEKRWGRVSATEGENRSSAQVLPQRVDEIRASTPRQCTSLCDGNRIRIAHISTTYQINRPPRVAMRVEHAVATTPLC
jgi:hypothetical protein